MDKNGDAGVHLNASHDIRAKKSKSEGPAVISYVTSNPNKLRETVQILGEEFSSMVS